MKHEDLVKQEFKKQAKDFSDKQLTLSRQMYLDWITQSFHLDQQQIVLDVAAGTGILSRAFAPLVKKVVAADLSEDMMEAGKSINEEQGIANIEYVSANVAQLPFAPDTYDIVISRFAFHHFTDAASILSEMKRVCKPNGKVCIVDMISPDDEALYQAYNDYERRRDPSHTEALRASRFEELFGQMNLQRVQVETVSVDVHVDNWLALTKTEEEIAVEIRRELREEVRAGSQTSGMYPFLSGDDLMFKQSWIKIIGEK